MTEQSGTAAASENSGESSIGDLLGDTADVVVRATQAWAEVRSDWEDRSRTDASWTTDTIMNEVVNSWERVTPLMGEAIDAGIAGMTWLLRNWWPSATEDLQVIQDSVQESPVGSVLGPYLDPPHDAVSRMLRDDYRSADVVEHWAQLFGMTVKEAWRASAGARETPNSEGGHQAPKSQPSTGGER